jgi:hypothetical protein
MFTRSAEDAAETAELTTTAPSAYRTDGRTDQVRRRFGRADSSLLHRDTLGESLTTP